MKKKKIRIIIDTNLWISFLISNTFSELDALIFEKKCILIFSDELLSEFIEVIQRPKFKSFFSEDDIESILDVIQKYANFIEVESKIKICRDFKDNFLLALSKDSKADFLITGDKDLLVLNRFESTTIITISDFIEKLK